MDRWIKLADCKQRGYFEGVIIGTENGEIGFATREFLLYADPRYLKSLESEYLTMMRVENKPVLNVYARSWNDNILAVPLSTYRVNNYLIRAAFVEVQQMWLATEAQHIEDIMA